MAKVTFPKTEFDGKRVPLKKRNGNGTGPGDNGENGNGFSEIKNWPTLQAEESAQNILLGNRKRKNHVMKELFGPTECLNVSIFDDSRSRGIH